MREVKVRAWDTERYKMVEQPYFFEIYHYSDELRINQQSYRYYEDWRDLEDGRAWFCEIMLYMGKVDENGKEICEGDILAITTQDKQDILVICRFGTIQRRMDTGFLCDITGFYFERSDGLNSLPIVKNYKGKHDLEMMQIVGNIYEHPNLLYTQSPVAK